MIIAVSNRTKNDIIKYYGIDPEKIKVIYQSCDDEFKNKSSNLLLNYNYKNKLTKPYFIFVGGTEKRKNLIFLLKVLKAQRNLNIICVGKKDSNYDNIKNYINQNKIDNQINFIKAKTTKDLASLYKNSLGLIYPSIDEGFGIPIIEAMNCSIPIIIPKNEICKEIGGKYSFYFIQNNIKSILEQLNYIINNKEEVKLRVLKNNDYVKKFSNKKQGEQLIELYQSLVYEQKNLDKIIYKTCTHLQSGGVILYPTDTVWGIGCDATNEAAIKKYSLKKRSKEKGLILLMSSKEMLDHYINDIPSIASEILKNNNEPTTIIYKNPINLPKLLIHQNSIAVRLVGKCFIHELIKNLTNQ